MALRKVAVVTGSAAPRVGRAVAEAFADLGYTLALHYRNSATAAQQAVASFVSRGVEAFACRADLADESAVHELVQAVLTRFGRVDALVNCAAIWKSARLERQNCFVRVA